MELALNFISSISMPVVLAIFGFLINRQLAGYRSKLTINVKLIEKRIALYDEIGPELHELYQFYRRVGRWRELSPAEILETKLKLDASIHVNKPYWSVEFFQCYMRFMQVCFTVNSRENEKTQIKANIDDYGFSADTLADNNAMFTGQSIDKLALDTAYDCLHGNILKDMNN